MPQGKFYDPEGREISAADLPQALAENRARPLLGTTIVMRTNEGEIRDVPAEAFFDARSKGAVPLSSEGVEGLERHEKYSSLGQKALTAAEGVGRGLSLGLTDVALGAALGDEYSDEAAARQAENPALSTGTEVLGAVAPIVASGGSGAAANAAAMTPAALTARAGSAVARATGAGARALGATGETVLGRAGLRALEGVAAGGIEGALVGAGHEISQAALHNAELTAENLMSAAIEGGATGAALGGALGFTGSVAAQGLRRAADDLPKLAQKIGADKHIPSAVVDAALDFVPGGYTIAGAIRKASALAGIGKAVARKADDAAEAAATRLRQAAESGDPITTALTAAGFSDDAIRTMPIERAKTIAETIGATGLVDASPKVRIGRIKEALDEADQLTKSIARQADAVSATAPDPVAVMREIRAAVPDEMAYTELQRPIKPLIKAAADGKRPKFADWQKAQRKVDGIADKYGDAPEIRKARDAIANSMVRSMVEANPEVGAQFAKALQRTEDLTALRSVAPREPVVASALAAGQRIAKTAEAAETAVSSVAEKASQTVANQVTKLGQKSDAAIRKILQLPKEPARAVEVAATLATQRTLATSDAPPAERDFAALKEEIAVYRADPIAYANTIGQQLAPLQTAQPAVAERLLQMALADAEWFATRMPRSISRADTSVTPAVEQATESTVQQSGATREIRAVLDPSSVLTDIESGSLDLRAIRALRERRPATYQQIRQTIMQYASERTEPLPYTTRVSLGVAFQLNTDRSLTPQYVAGIQQDYLESSAEREEQTERRGTPPIGTNELSALAESDMTSAQRLAGGM